MARRIPIIMLAILILVILQAGFFSRFAFFNNRWIEFINPAVVFVLIYSLFERRHRRLSFILRAGPAFYLTFIRKNFWLMDILVIIFNIID